MLIPPFTVDREVITMDKLLVVCLLMGFASSQYDQRGGGGGGGFHHSSSPQQPPANILLHKQALGQDGSFNYAFAADNGLQQGEIINPDGSRKGSYSYVDPNGKTVSLSYTAGKDGFRVLNGDHLPKPPAPQPQPQQPQHHHQQHQQPPHHQYYNPQQQYTQQPFPQQPQHEPPKHPIFRPNPVPIEAYKNSPHAPVYRGNLAPYDESSRHPHHPPPPPPPQYRIEPAPYRQPSQPQLFHYQPRQYSVQEGNYDKPAPFASQQYQGYRPEDPRKPHSFGNGYSFEFAG